MLFLISGAAATGKKSVVKILKDKLDNFECHDFDETSVKSGGNKMLPFGRGIE